MIRAVIFDVYETLITHYHGKSALYFSPQMAAEAGVSLSCFQEVWRGREIERTVGKVSLEETLQEILEKNTSDSTNEVAVKVAQMTEKRIATAECCFQNLHPEILPMFEGLKTRGIKIGLISNCFSEEARVIKDSVLASYCDVICLSYDLGMRKPEAQIYAECVRRLGVSPEECLYVGDGGSSELEAAEAFGMKALQAMWYLKNREDGVMRKKEAFENLLSPLEVVNRTE